MIVNVNESKNARIYTLTLNKHIFKIIPTQIHPGTCIHAQSTQTRATHKTFIHSIKFHVRNVS